MTSVASESEKIPAPYEDLLREIMEIGAHKGDRTGTGTVSVFGRQIRYDLSKGFPLITTKFVAFRLILIELIWFLKGDSNIRFLLEHDCHIWTEWAFKDYLKKTEQPIPAANSEEWKLQMKAFEQRVLEDEAFSEEYGNLGAIYGVQWRSWPTPSGSKIDQLAKVIEQIKQTPDSRRLIVTAWNPDEVDDVPLPPCHVMFQFYVVDGKLSCHLFQRSADMFLGVPFNIASYALLTCIIAKITGLQVGDFVWTGSDCHIYLNHFDQVKEQLANPVLPLPELELLGDFNAPEEIDPSSVKILNYQSAGRISAPVAV